MRGYYKDEHRYDDMIHLPHHQSVDRAHMSFHDRAAQFAPFAALSGHEEALREVARLTDEPITLSENAIEIINQKLYELSQNISKNQKVSITYFRPDMKKRGGAYLTDVGRIKKIDEIEKVVVMENGIKILMEDIVDIKSGE